MPSRGSGLEVAVARTTFSPNLTTAAPPACLASFPVSIDSCFPPASSTETLVASGFIIHPFFIDGNRAEGAPGDGVRGTDLCQGRDWETHSAMALEGLETQVWKSCPGTSGLEPAPHGAGRAATCGFRAWILRSYTVPSRTSSGSPADYVVCSPSSEVRGASRDLSRAF